MAKDITISGKAIRREEYIALACLVVACGLNVYATIHYKRPASELYSNIGFVLTAAAGIYVVLGILRLIVLMICKLVRLIRK